MTSCVNSLTKQHINRAITRSTFLAENFPPAIFICFVLFVFYYLMYTLISLDSETTVQVRTEYATANTTDATVFTAIAAQVSNAATNLFWVIRKLSM